jgi:hypothetical protein
MSESNPTLPGSNPSDEQKDLMPESARSMGTGEILRYGLGNYLSISGGVLLLVCAFLVRHAYSELAFVLQKDPKNISVEEIGSLKNNDYIRLTCALDYEKGLDIETLGGKRYSLFPVSGTNNALIVFQQGLTTTGELDRTNRTLTGRIVGKDWADEYDVEANRIKLQEQFARMDIVVPEAALILAAGSTSKFKVWPMVVGVVGALVIFHFLGRLWRTVGFISDRAELVAHINALNRGNTAKPT